jgi:hypothetical protein
MSKAKERLEAIASWLEAGAPEKAGVRFDMRRVYCEAGILLRSGTWCGSTVCMAGAAVQFFGTKKQRENMMRFAEWEPWKVGEQARGLLGLSTKKANQLFFPDTEGSEEVDLEEIDASWAARCLRRFIDAGVVSWNETRLPQAAPEVQEHQRSEA